MRIHSKCIENKNIYLKKENHEIVVVVHLFRYSFHPKHHVKFRSIEMNCFVHHDMDCDVKEFIRTIKFKQKDSIFSCSILHNTGSQFRSKIV